MFLFAVFAIFIVLVVGAIFSKKTVKAAVRGGMILTSFSLVASLFFPMFLDSRLLPEEVQYITNSLLILAGVGANIFATGICSGLKSWLEI